MRLKRGENGDCGSHWCSGRCSYHCVCAIHSWGTLVVFRKAISLPGAEMYTFLGVADFLAFQRKKPKDGKEVLELGLKRFATDHEYLAAYKKYLRVFMKELSNKRTD